jgi:hypothetical protein
MTLGWNSQTFWCSRWTGDLEDDNRQNNHGGVQHMRTMLSSLKIGSATPALFVTASLAIATLVASSPADARWGGGRGGIGVGRVGSGLGYRPGLGVGRAGIGVAGWRNGVGVGRLGYGYGRGYGYRGYGYRGLGYGAAALTGAALAYGAGSYGYGYGDPYGYGYTGLYSYSPESSYCQ